MVDACKSLLEHRGIGSFQFCEEAVNGEASNKTQTFDWKRTEENEKRAEKLKNLQVKRQREFNSIYGKHGTSAKLFYSEAAFLSELKKFPIEQE